MPVNATSGANSGAAGSVPPASHGLFMESTSTGPSLKYAPDWTDSPAGMDTPAKVAKPPSATCQLVLGCAGTP